MDSALAIKVEGLSKRYQLGSMRQAYSLLSENIGDFVRSRILGRTVERPAASREDLWALKDVSFEVRRGEVLGVIGRNGAGKSTLLKILSRITTPSAGRIEINGRVGSLLEVGTGFHPELTGRENIYLNGSILGMTKTEIQAKFDEIVAFSEIERFIDTPVKRYSSGMHVRLGFAVAAHLQPEILIIDEVLSVGDAAFQKKSFGRMSEFTDTGRTILFVSHNLNAIMALCKKALVLDKGEIVFLGPAHEAVEFYLALHEQDSSEHRVDARSRGGDGSVRLTSFHLEDADRNPLDVATNGRPVRFVFDYEAKPEALNREIFLAVVVRTPSSEVIFQLGNHYTGKNISLSTATGRLVLQIDRLPLVPGRYIISTNISTGFRKELDVTQVFATFTVVGGDFFGSGYEVVDMAHSKFLVDGDVYYEFDNTEDADGAI